MPIDYKNYPKDWKERRERILKRATNPMDKVPCCEMCGLANGQHVMSVKDKNTGKRIWLECLGDAFRVAGVNQLQGNSHLIKRVKVVLTIAHLDHDEDNEFVTDDRLMAMCQYCHLNYDKSEKKRRRKQRSNDSTFRRSKFQNSMREKYL